MDTPFEGILLYHSIVGNKISVTVKKGRSVVGEILLIDNKFPLYETACDNQGFRAAETKYIIEIQSDIYIDDFGLKKMIYLHYQSFLLQYFFLQF